MMALYDLPNEVREAVPDTHAQEILRDAFNRQIESGTGELRSWVEAYKSLGEAGFQFSEIHKVWVEKDSPTVSDVHVNRPIGAVRLNTGSRKRKRRNKPEILKRISGQSDIGLNAQGETQASQLGAFFSQSGGLDVLYSSPLNRAVQTAEGIKAYDSQLMRSVTRSLLPWNLGSLEGKSSEDVSEKIAFLLSHPDVAAEGYGLDGSAGESLDTCKKRLLGFLESLFFDFEKTDKIIKTGVIMHSRNTSLFLAWLKAGSPEDFKIPITEEAAPEHGLKHGSVLQWSEKNVAKPVDTFTSIEDLPPGIYLIIHGLTEDDTDEASSADADSPESLQEKIFLPPVEVMQAAEKAQSTGFVIEGITSPLAKGSGLNADNIRKVHQFFTENDPDEIEYNQRDAWGGYFASRWAARVVKKLEEKPETPAVEVTKQGSGVMVAFSIPEETGAQLKVDGGETTDTMHVTLAYLGKEISPEQLAMLDNMLKDFAKVLPPQSGHISGPARFPATKHSEGKDVAVALFNSPDIQEFRTCLVDCINATGIPWKNNFGFTPHVTLKYIDPEDEMPTARIDPIAVRFPAISLYSNGEKTDYLLTGNAITKASEADDEIRWVTVHGVHIPIGGRESTKSDIARRNYVKTNRDEQRKADEAERKLADSLGFPRTANNDAFDLVKGKVAIEIKALLTNKNDKITMKKEARERKLKVAAEKNLRMYTVVADHRGGSGSRAHYYFSAGVGSFRLGSMKQVTLDQLKRLLI